MTDTATPKPPLTDPTLLRDTMTAALAEPAYWDADGYNTITEFHRDEWRLILDLIGAGIAARCGLAQGTTEIVQLPDGSWVARPTGFYNTTPSALTVTAPPAPDRLVTDERPDPLEVIARSQGDQDWTHPTPIAGITGTVDPNAHPQTWVLQDNPAPVTGWTGGPAPAPTLTHPLEAQAPPSPSRPRLHLPGWVTVNPDADVPHEDIQPDASHTTTRGGG